MGLLMDLEDMSQEHMTLNFRGRECCMLEISFFFKSSIGDIYWSVTTAINVTDYPSSGKLISETSKRLHYPNSIRSHPQPICLSVPFLFNL